MDIILPTIHGLEVVAACTFGYVSKERWGKLDLGYILDESYDHTKLPKSHVVNFSKPLIPFSLFQVQKLFLG